MTFISIKYNALNDVLATRIKRGLINKKQKIYSEARPEKFLNLTAGSKPLKVSGHCNGRQTDKKRHNKQHCDNRRTTKRDC